MDELNIEEVLEEVAETPTISEVQEEKVLEKVEEKKNTKRKAKSTKECKVLAYNKAKQFMIISFDGYGIRIDEVAEKPGETVEVKYSGKIGTPSFKLDVVKK